MTTITDGPGWMSAASHVSQWALLLTNCLRDTAQRRVCFIAERKRSALNRALYG